MNTIRAAVIGIGNMGSAHASQIYRGNVQGMELTAVCDCDPGRREWAASTLPGVRIYEDYRELLAERPVDAIVVATPHPLHPVIVMEALEQGYHVLTEKPAGIDVGSVRRMNEVAARSGQVFGIMYNQRTNPLFQELRRRYQNGDLGELIRFTWTVTNWYRTQSYYDSGSWRATWNGEGGGVLMNQSPHNLDIWQWITGMPERIYARCPIARFHDIHVEDEAEILAEYGSGATAVFITSTGEFPGTNRLELSGTRGKAVMENGRLTLTLMEGDQDIRSITRSERASMPHSLPMRTEVIEQHEEESGHLGILNDFSAAIREGTPLLAPGTDGIYGLSIANAAYLSQAENRWVSLPLDAEAYERVLRQRQQAEQERQQAAGMRGAQHVGEYTGEYSERWKVRW